MEVATMDTIPLGPERINEMVLSTLFFFPPQGER